MRLRYARSLTEEEWNRVVAALKRGPTPEQVRTMERAREIAGHIDDPATVKKAGRRAQT